MKKILLILFGMFLAIGILFALGYANVTTTDAVERITTFYVAICCTALIILGTACIVFLGD